MNELYRQHAWIYDAAFSWDVTAEVDWLLGRMGPDVTRVLEPFCGAGRLFPAFARRGVSPTGVDLSPKMLELAREKMRRERLPEPRLLLADAADFALGERFDGAYCPVNSFAYLSSVAAAASHLECVARHLGPGGRYLVQLDLRSPGMLRMNHPEDQGKWEVDHTVGRIAATWFVRDYDSSRGVELHVARFEILSGERAGETVETVHEMRLWDWTAWRDLVAESPFVQTGAFDGNRPERGRLSVGRELLGRPLVWHELTVSGDGPTRGRGDA